MTALLKFLRVVFQVLGQFSNVIASLAQSIPSSVYSLEKSIGHSVHFTKYVVCPKCHHLYKFDECVIHTGDRKRSKTCAFIQFPNHPQHRFRKECGHLLLKTVNFFHSGRQILYPLKAFPYKSLSSSLQQLLLRPGFAELCQSWKLREAPDMLEDVYDGKIWKEFQVVDGQPFLSGDWGIGLMINVDWFQPYKHTNCSVGAIYLTIMNLPRSVRFRRENVILIGILPGPNEPKHDINSYIQPLVDELSVLWIGQLMQVRKDCEVSSELIRCALLCVACDLPAGRKLCGFLGHSAKLGCARCLKVFSGSVGSMNYSGFDRNSWPPRTNSTHRKSVEKVLQCNTKQQQSTTESSEGCRYSSLLRLKYFDPVRMLSIDPMHNLFLGTGKHMLELWLNLGIINSRHFAHLQEFVDRMVVPNDVGRIPRKIATGFSGFTADQFKNWITIYSIPSLHGILPRQHLECWRFFVLSCRILCKRKLSTADVSLFDALLIRFCTHVQDIYGESSITPNMHMHGHLKEVVEDYGPVYAFWLFSYERYNGILESQPNNNRAMEPQLMNRFLKDNVAYTFEFPSAFSKEFSPVCNTVTKTHAVGSLSTTTSTLEEEEEKFLSVSTKGILDSEDKQILSYLYGKINRVECSDVTINSVFQKYMSLLLKGKLYTCNRSSTYCVALAEWNDDIFGPPPTPLLDATHPESKFRPIKIRHYLKITVCHGERIETISLASVQWFIPYLQKDGIGKPVQLWRNDFEVGALYSFLPVQYLKCRCSFCNITYNNEPVLAVVPLVE